LTEKTIPQSPSPQQNVLKSSAFKNFFIYLLQGISFFAHRAKQASMTDPQVDRFTAEALGILVGEAPLSLDDFQKIAVKALEMRKTAAALYERACNEGGIRREPLPGRATIEFFTDKKNLAAQARGLSAKKTVSDPRDFYWESVCIERLGTIGSIVTSDDKSIDREYDVSGFLHKALDYLSKDLSSVELVAMADQLEKARLKIVNALLAGNTLVDIPAPRITLSDIKKTKDQQ
jgi:hydroxylamine reductase